MTKAIMSVGAAMLLATPGLAQQPDLSAFATGPVFEDFGPHAPVEGIEPFSKETEFAIAFDVAAKEADGERNGGFESAARFINMHVAADVPGENIRLVVVVHGRAVLDLITDEARTAREMEANASAAMVGKLIEHGVMFMVCGQSAAANGIAKADLIEGVGMDLSAMTIHAELQQQGFTVNPF